MLRSLRFRVPALFLIGIVLSGVVAARPRVGFFQNYVQNRVARRAAAERDRPREPVRRAGDCALDQDRPPVPLSATDLEAASGNSIYYVGRRSSSRTTRACAGCRTGSSPTGARRACARSTSAPPGADKTYFAVGRACARRGQRYGVLVVATPKDELRDAWLTLMQRLGIAFLVGIAVVGGARLVPLAAHHAAGARARGRGGRGRRRPLRRRAAAAGEDEIGRPDAPVRRDGQAAQRGRGARAQLPHDRLARAAHAADRDPRPCRRAARGAGRGPGAARAVARGDRARVHTARAARRRRARPRQARRPPLHRPARGGRHAGAARAGLRGVRRGGAAAEHRLPVRR